MEDMVEHWEKNLRSKLNNQFETLHCGIHPEETIVQLKHKKKTNQQTPLPFFIIVIAMALSAFNFFMMSQKPIQKNPPRVIMAGQVPPSKTPDDKITKFVEKQNLHADKILLLTYMNNENMALIQKLDPANASKYLFLDENWKLNKAPELLKLNQVQKDAIKNFMPDPKK